MFTDDSKLIAKMAPRLRRVLIVDPHPASARLLADLMRSLVNAQIVIAPSARKGLAAAQDQDFQIVFVELSGPDTDGIEFTRRFRRGTAVCRQAPVVIITAEAKAQAILGARDAGASEFLRKPYTTKDLLRRLAAVTLHPRDWVEAVAYVGPDRRRFNSGDYTGPLKRRADVAKTPDAARIDQALRIIKSAVAAVDTDPAQALRSMQTQLTDLLAANRVRNDRSLAAAITVFQQYLAGVTEKTQRFTAADAAQRAAPLLAMLPKDGASRGAAA